MPSETLTMGIYERTQTGYRCVVCGQSLPLRRSGMGRVSHARRHVRMGTCVQVASSPASYALAAPTQGGTDAE